MDIDIQLGTSPLQAHKTAAIAVTACSPRRLFDSLSPRRIASSSRLALRTMHFSVSFFAIAALVAFVTTNPLPQDDPVGGQAAVAGGAPSYPSTPLGPFPECPSTDKPGRGLFITMDQLNDLKSVVNLLIPGYTGKARYIPAQTSHIPTAGSFLITVPVPGTQEKQTIERFFNGCVCVGDGIHISMSGYTHFTQIPFAAAFGDDPKKIDVSF